MFAANLGGVMVSKLQGKTYWRIHGNDISWQSGLGNYLAGIHRVSFYESSDASGTDINIGATSTSSSVYDGSGLYVASKANDDNSSTYWASSPALSENHWWSCHYLSSKQVQSVVIHSGAGPYLAKSYKLQYSYDGVSWFDKSTFATAFLTTVQTFTNL